MDQITANNEASLGERVGKCFAVRQFLLMNKTKGNLSSCPPADMIGHSQALSSCLITTTTKSSFAANSSPQSPPPVPIGEVLEAHEPTTPYVKAQQIMQVTGGIAGLSHAAVSRTTAAGSNHG